MAGTYIPYSPEVEVRRDDEERLTAEILEITATINRKGFERHRQAVRGAHAKSHGFLKGELFVPELPGHLRQGLFARPATYPIVIRLSSAASGIYSDTIPAVRGMAIKVIGVDGERLLPGDQGRNQDFLLNNMPVLSFGTIGKYRRLIGVSERITESPAFLQRAIACVARGVEAAVKVVGVEPDATLRGLARNTHHLLGETYHSMGAIRFGGYIAKISAAPLSDNVRALTGKRVGTVQDRTMRELVVEHFRQQSADYQLRAQLCTDLEKMPVEDAAVLWPEELSPHQPIATLRIPPQDAYSPARRAYGDDVLSFNSWHGISEHRPLGSLMRVRMAAYERSARFRFEMNAQARIEPESIEAIPD